MKFCSLSRNHDILCKRYFPCVKAKEYFSYLYKWVTPNVFRFSIELIDISEFDSCCCGRPKWDKKVHKVLALEHFFFCFCVDLMLYYWCIFCHCYKSHMRSNSNYDFIWLQKEIVTTRITLILMQNMYWLLCFTWHSSQ